MKKILEKIKNFFKYFFEKRVEIKELKIRDLKQANIITQIELFKLKTEKLEIELNKLKFFLHPIDHLFSIKKLKTRQKKILKYKEKILESKKISKKILDKTMPSITDIKVVELERDKFLVWEGNGRIKALQKVFNKNKNIKVEVTNFVLTNLGLTIVKELLDDLDKN